MLFLHLYNINQSEEAQNKFEVSPQKIKKPIFKPLPFEKEYSLGIEKRPYQTPFRQGRQCRKYLCL